MRKKTPSVTPLRPGKNGGQLRSGNPGNKGGRPPGTWTEFLRELRSDPEVQDAVKRAATDPSSPGFRAAMKVMADYDDEKPAEKRQIVGPVEVRVTIEREGRRTTAG